MGGHFFDVTQTNCGTQKRELLPWRFQHCFTHLWTNERKKLFLMRHQLLLQTPETSLRRAVRRHFQMQQVKRRTGCHFQVKVLRQNLFTLTYIERVIQSQVIAPTALCRRHGIISILCWSHAGLFWCPLFPNETSLGGGPFSSASWKWPFPFWGWLPLYLLPLFSLWSSAAM